MKKFWKYFSITLMLLVGLFCIGLIYLFFDQNANIFGLTYISHNKLIKSKEYETTAVSTIIINSRAYEVKVTDTEDETIQLVVYDNSMGYTTTKHSNVVINENLRNAVLTFNINETYGAVAKNDSYVLLLVPKDFQVNLNLSNKKADTTITGDELKLNNVTYSTKSGNLMVNECSITGKLDLTINSATCTLGEELRLFFNSVDLGITKGKFNASTAILGDVKIKYNNRGNISIKHCSKLYQNETTSGGNLTINQVGTMDFTGSTTNVSVEEITVQAVITTKSGKVVVGSISGNSRITTEDGNVTVEKNVSPLDLETTTGNVTIKNAYAKVKVVTTNGAVNVNFAEDTPDYDNENGYRTLNAVIKSGTINATGVQHTEIEIQDGGTANISMDKVTESNTINVKNGQLNLVIAHDAVYTLTTNAEANANVRVNLLQIPEYRGYTQTENTTTNVNCNSTSQDTLSVTCNSGSITILDTELD